MTDLPARPYIQNGRPSSGYSQVDTSAAGEESRAASQPRVFQAVSDSGFDGRTFREVSRETGIKEQTVSGALSDLHKVGLLARLKDSRGRAKLYTLPHYTFGRETEEHTSHGRKVCPNCGTSL